MMMYKVLVFLLMTTFAFGQNVEFVGSVDQSKFPMNSTIRITYSLNVIGNNFKFPKVDKLNIVSGPSVRTNVQIINGQKTQSVSYTVLAIATQEGLLEIPPASIDFKGKTYQSNGIKIEITEGEQLEQTIIDGKTFARMELSDSIAYPGQRIQLIYSVYTQEDISGINFVENDDLLGFHSLLLDSPRGYTKVDISGKTYYKRTFVTYALFPQKTGVYDVDPFTITVAKPYASRQRSFFQSTKSEVLISNGLTIEVKDLPPGAPESFSGAVGKFLMDTKIKNNTYTTNDPILMEMRLQGTGDSKYWDAPKQTNFDGLDYYDPKLVDERNVKSQWGDAAYKKYDYLILADQPGNYRLQPEFTYFDTDSLKYITIYGTTHDIKVIKGEASDIETDLNASIQQQEEKSEKGFNWWFTIPFLLIIGGLVYWWKFRKGTEYQKSEAELEAERKARADKVALTILARSKQYIEEGKEKAFFVEVAKALNKFLGDKYDVTIADRKPEVIKAVLKENNIAQDTIDSYLEIMKKSELSIYAKQSQSDMSDTLKATERLIKSMVE